MKKTLEGRRIGVLGLGRSGSSASELAARSGAQVFATEQDPSPDTPLDNLRRLGVELELGRHSDSILSTDLVVVSPGIRNESEVVAKVRKKGIPVVSELEFAWSFLPRAHFVAVTGTNGKSTSCALLAAMIDASGRQVMVGGNIGTPLSALVDEVDVDTFVVCEVSTFQLENILEFRPAVSVLTNISEDHLDRHRTLSAYVDLKKRIFELQTEKESAVINLEDRLSMEVSREIRSTKYFFTDRSENERGTFIRDGIIYFKNGYEGRLLPAKSVDIARVTTIQNVLAAATAAAIVGIEPGAIESGVRGFKGLPHRLELIMVRDGVTWINNSMCTNPIAARTSIQAVGGSIVLIAGGKSKGLDPAPLIDTIVRSVRFAILIGEAREDLAQRLANRGFRAFSCLDTLQEAVDAAHLEARQGESVLLCPGYSSQDAFVDFRQRGEEFKRAVRKLYGLSRRDNPVAE